MIGNLEDRDRVLFLGLLPNFRAMGVGGCLINERGEG